MPRIDFKKPKAHHNTRIKQLVSNFIAIILSSKIDFKNVETKIQHNYYFFKTLIFLNSMYITCFYIHII